MYYNTKELFLDGETWKDVVGWEEIYQVSNFGRIKCKKRVLMYDRNLNRGIEKKTVYEKIRKPKLNKHTGYLMVGLNGKGKAQNATIHSMVAKAFIKNFKSGKKANSMCVNHKDGNKLNNSINNLEVVTIRENIMHMFKNNLTTSNHPVEYKGIEYYSKSEMRRALKMSEKKQNELIKSGEIVLINEVIK